MPAVIPPKDQPKTFEIMRKISGEATIRREGRPKAGGDNNE